jgi:hypothetical protein
MHNIIFFSLFLFLKKEVNGADLLYRKIGRKITFDFKALYIGPEEVFWEY